MKTIGIIALAAFALATGQAVAQAPDAKTVVIGVSSDSDSWDPDEITSRDAANIEKLMFGTLYDVAADGKLVPYLADSYAFEKDGTEIKFKLHPGLKCPDGSALTANDVA